MTAPLSYTEKYAWGLRVNPSFDELQKTVKRPWRVPLPDRSAKWYANSVYRSFLLDQSLKYNDYEHLRLDYQSSGAQLPEEAARVTPSAAGEDPAFAAHERFNDGLHEQDAYETAFEAMNAEHRQQTAELRREQLSSYGPVRGHWAVEAHHQDLQDAGVPHRAPLPRAPMQRMPWPAAHQQYVATGQPQAPQFRPLEELNFGQQRRHQPTAQSHTEAGQTYERLRENAFGR
jgi:hypothetical protein